MRHEVSTRRTVLKSAGAVSALGLAGCIGDDDDDGTDSGDDDDGNGNGDSATVEFWHPLGGDVGEILDEFVTDFNDQSDHTVEHSQQGNYNEVLDATMSAANAGDPPHIAMIGPGMLYGAKESGLFTPVSEIVGDVDYDQFASGLVNFFQIEDEFWAWPLNNSTTINYYNLDIYEEAGLPDPRDDPPTTFEEVGDHAATIVEETDVSNGISFNHHQWFTRQWFALGGQTLFNNENGHEGHPTEINLDNDLATEIWSWWGDLYDEGSYLYPGRRDGQAVNQAFISQEVGIIASSSASIAGLFEGAEDAGFEIASGPYLAPQEERVGQVLGGGALATPSDGYESDAHRAAAAEFLQWMSSPEIQAEWHKQTGYIPMHVDALDLLEEENWFEERPEFSPAVDAMFESEDVPATRNPMVDPFGETMDLLDDVFEFVIDGTPVDEALANGKEDIDSVLGQYS